MTYDEFIGRLCLQPKDAERLVREHPEWLETPGHLQETPLHYLAVEGVIQSVRALINAGADVNVVNYCGNTPLMECALLGNIELIENGAQLEALSEPEMRTAAHFAAENSQFKVLDILRGAGCNMEIKDAYGETALDLAKANLMDADGDIEDLQVQEH